MGSEYIAAAGAAVSLLGRERYGVTAQVDGLSLLGEKKDGLGEERCDGAGPVGQEEGLMVGGPTHLDLSQRSGCQGLRGYSRESFVGCWRGG
jgi:hypothetical protein